MRSVVVVLPASMCAMIPMLRTRSSAVGAFVTDADMLLMALPPVVRESLVGLRHAVLVVLLLERAALLIQRVEKLARELALHPLFAPFARVNNEPADRQRACAP